MSFETVHDGKEKMTSKSTYGSARYDATKTLRWFPQRFFKAIVFAAVFVMLSSAALAGSYTASLSPSSSAPCIIEVLDEVQVTGDRLYLKDVARIVSSGEMMRNLSMLDLGLSPKPGQERRLSGKRIESVIKLTPNLPEDIIIKSPETVRILRSFQLLPKGALEEIYSAYLREKIADGQFEITRFRVRGENSLPVGNIDYIINDPVNDSLIGWTNMRVDILVNGVKADFVVLSAFINRYGRVLYARNEVYLHQRITADDVSARIVNLAEVPPNLVNELSDVIGKRAKSLIHSGELFRENLVEIPPMVEKGKHVKLIAKKGLVEVSTIGVAVKNGQKDEQIPVMNLKSKKIIMGRVVDTSTVYVMF